MLRQLWIDARIRFAALFGRRQIRSRAAEELQFHLAMREQRHIERGLAPGEARAQARRELGNPTLLTERALDSWRYAFVSTLIQDVRYGLRGFRRNPGFAATAALSLALGIGANTAIFRLFDALLFRPLPVKSAEELVLVTQKMGDQRSLMLTNGDREAFSGSATLAGLCASRHSRMRVTRSGESQFAEGMFAGGNCFALLGVSTVLGRTITEADDQPSANALVAVLSYGYWQRQFGADPSAIGQNIDLDGRPFTIVGVAPPGFIGLEPGAPADVIVPLTSFHSPLLANPDVHWLRLLGRRKPGVSIQQVQADLQVRASRISQTLKANRCNAGRTAGSGPCWERIRGGSDGVFASAAPSDGGCRVGPVDRLRESCQPPARADQWQASGNGFADGAWGWAGQASAPVPDREPAVVRAGWPGRNRNRVDDEPGTAPSNVTRPNGNLGGSAHGRPHDSLYCRDKPGYRNSYSA